MDRIMIYNSLIDNVTCVKIVNGKNKGKQGIVVKKSEVKNYSYRRKNCNYTYNNYFEVWILTNNGVIKTSCNNIAIK